MAHLWQYSPRCVLVGTNDGGIDMMCLPIQLARCVSLGLHVGKDAVPDTGLLPAGEPGRDGGRRTIVCRQVGPWCTGAKNSQDAVDNRSVIVARATPFTPFGGPWRWKQRLQSLPLCVSQISSMHTDSLPKGLRIRPSPCTIVWCLDDHPPYARSSYEV